MRENKKRTIEVGLGLLHGKEALHAFKECVVLLNRANAPLRHYYELVHEFGHVAGAEAYGGKVVYIKIEEHLFDFHDQDTLLTSMSVTYSRNKGHNTQALMYFPEGKTDEWYTEAWSATVRGGIDFSTSLRKEGIKSMSFKANRFNKINAWNEKYARKSPDRKTLTEFVKDPTAAREFNEAALGIVKDYTEWRKDLPDVGLLNTANALEGIPGLLTKEEREHLMSLVGLDNITDKDPDAPCLEAYKKELSKLQPVNPLYYKLSIRDRKQLRKLRRA